MIKRNIRAELPRLDTRVGDQISDFHRKHHRFVSSPKEMKPINHIMLRKLDDYVIQGRHSSEGRFGPCLDFWAMRFGFQYALTRNNGSKNLGVEYWTLPC